MRIYSFIEKKRVRKRRKKLLIFVTILLAVLTMLIFFSMFSTTKIETNLITPRVEAPLSKSIRDSLTKAEGVYAISVKNLKTNEGYSLNENKIYDAGSLYKLWTMVMVYQQIEAGIIEEDEILSEDIAALNKSFNISSDSAELTEGTITLSVSDALNQMITISHNYAAMLLTKKVKLSEVAKFLNKYGFNKSYAGADREFPKTSASDISLFFEKLYKGELANPENTIKMIELLKKQQLNNKLPKLLPEGSVIAHKTGEINYLTHDAGIVYSPKGDYIIVVLSESTFPPGAEDRIARISKTVYDYFNSNNP